jgi:Flp pilus assembly protein CpaB
MARGWESKSVEAQQQEAADPRASAKPRLTRQQAEKLRQIQAFRLSLRRVVDQLQNSHASLHRAMLEQASADLRRQIEKLESPD